MVAIPMIVPACQLFWSEPGIFFLIKVRKTTLHFPAISPAASPCLFISIVWLSSFLFLCNSTHQRTRLNKTHCPLSLSFSWSTSLSFLNWTLAAMSTGACDEFKVLSCHKLNKPLLRNMIPMAERFTMDKQLVKMRNLQRWQILLFFCFKKDQHLHLLLIENPLWTLCWKKKKMNWCFMDDD